MDNNKEISELRAKVEEFRTVKFPKNSSNEVISDLFMDLVAYDSYIAGLIDRAGLGQKVPRDKLIYDIELERKLEESIHIQELNSKDKGILNSYLIYLIKIKDLLREIEAVNLTF